MRLAKARCEALGVDPTVFSEECPDEKEETGTSGSLYMHDPVSLLLSESYNRDGFWPPLPQDNCLGSGRRRPASGYDGRMPGVVDRLFSGPLVQGTSEKEIRKVKSAMNKTVVLPKRPQRYNSRPTTSETPFDATDRSGLDCMADTIFNEDRPMSPLESKNIKKLSYAEKLQVMIMQVQDTMKEDKGEM